MRNYIEDAPQDHSLDESFSPLEEMTQETLLNVLNISENTIRLNRAGKLTRDQETFVKQHQKHDDDATWLLTTIFMGTAVLLAMIFALQGLSMSYLLLGGFIFFGAFALYSTSRRFARSRDLELRVGKTTGDLRLIRSNSLKQWGLVIGDKFFAISENLAEKFDGYQHPFVAAYYTLGTNTLLSIEVVGPQQKRKNDELLDQVEQPLASWDKPKNTLALDDTPETSAEVEAEPQTEQAQEQSTSSTTKRRF
jgi:hypothetical protein